MSTKSSSRESFKKNTFKSKLGTTSSFNLDLTSVVTGQSAPFRLPSTQIPGGPIGGYGSADAFEISSRGTDLYVVQIGSGSCTIHYHTAPTPFAPLSEFTYQTSHNFGSGAKRMVLSEDGTKLYLLYFISTGANTLAQYTLSTPFNLSSSTLDVNWEGSFRDWFGIDSVGSISTISFSKNGRYVYLVDANYNKGYQLELTTPWDLRTKRAIATFHTGASGHDAAGLTFSADGLKMFIPLSTFNIEEYTLERPYAIGTAVKRANLYLKNEFGPLIGAPAALDFSEDGKKLYFGVSTPDDYMMQVNLANAYDLTSAEYPHASKSLYTNSFGQSQPRGIFVGNSGNSIYVIGNGPVRINQLNLSEAWDPNTASNVAVLAVSAYTESTGGLYVGNSGYSIYFSDQSDDRVIQFNMSTPWNLSTASFANVNFGSWIDGTSTSTKYPTNYESITFNQDGSQIIISGADITPYRLSRPWDISSIINYGLRTNPLYADPSGFTFKPDGTTLYISQGARSNVYQYSLSIPWEESTAVLEKNFRVVPQITTETGVSGVELSADGSNLYVSGTIRDNIYQWTLNTPWDIGTANTFVSNINLLSTTANPSGPRFSPDGTKMFVLNTSTDRVHQFTLNVPWMVSTASNVFSFNITTLDVTPSDIRFGDNGYRMYVIGTANDNPRQLLLGNPYDLTSNVTTGPAPSTFFDELGETEPQGFYVRPDGKRGYIVGTTRDTIYSVFLGNAWDVSSGEFGFRHFYSTASTYPGLFWSNTGTSLFTLINDTTATQFYSSNVQQPFDLTQIDFSVGRRDAPFNDFSLYGSGPDYISISSDNRYLYVCHETSDVIRRYEFKDPTNPQINELLAPFKINTNANWINTSVIKDIEVIPGDSSNVVIVTTAGGNNPQLPTAIKRISMPEGNVWNLASNTGSYLATAPFDTDPTSIEFLQGGTKLMIAGNQRVRANILLLSTPYNPASYTAIEGNTLIITTQIPAVSPAGLFVTPAGDELYVAERTNSSIHRYRLPVANSLVNATTSNFANCGIRTMSELDTFHQNVGPVGIALTGDGAKFFLTAKNYTADGTLDPSKSNVLQLEMPIPYDLATSTWNGLKIGPLEDYGQFATLDSKFASDGKSLYFLEIYSSSLNRIIQMYLIDRNVIGL